MSRRITVTITLPERLWREARAAAIARGTSASRVIETLLHQWLNHEPPATNDSWSSPATQHREVDGA